MTLLQKYHALYRQGFVPIFVADRFDAVMLAEASIAAGARVIEVTCRRAEALSEIQRIKARFPELIVLAGSTVDDGAMLHFLKRRRTPPMPSLADLASAGADGFVSAMALSTTTIARWSRTHLLIPGVETVSEAVAVLEAGAHFAKLFTADLVGGPARVRRMTSAPLHGLLPLFVTGGISLQRIAEYVDAGAILLGAGWDLMLADRYQPLQNEPHSTALAEALKSFLVAMSDARKTFAPRIASLSVVEGRQLVDALPHYHPFGEADE